MIEFGIYNDRLEQIWRIVKISNRMELRQLVSQLLTSGDIDCISKYLKFLLTNLQTSTTYNMYTAVAMLFTLIKNLSFKTNKLYMIGW